MIKSNLILTLALTLVVSSSLFAQSEIEQIEKTVNYYLKGGTNGDREMVTKAFHEKATLQFVRDGEHVLIPIADFLARIKDKQERKTRIVYINHEGDAAQAKVKIEYETFDLIDYFNLLKVNGEWKIISKIFIREDKT
ncbi:MAG: nuclear transport factor 2 family protein [Bacteroidota bacterium]